MFTQRNRRWLKLPWLVTLIVLSILLMVANASLLQAHGTVDQSFTGDSGGNFFAPAVSLSPVSKGQEFTPTASNLVAVDLNLFGLNTCSDTLTVKIRELTINGTVLASTSPVVIGCGVFYRHIDFGVVPITPGAIHVIEVSSAGSDQFRWVADSGYPGGSAIGHPFLNKDFGFRTYFQTVNQAPVANAGPDQTVEWTGGPVGLNGAGSTDPDGGTLTFSWSFVSKPAGSIAILTGASTATPSFTPDKLGAYVVQLVVSDGQGGTSTDAVTVTVQDTTAPTASASLVPVPGKVEAAEGRFTAVFSCSDACDPNPQTTGVMVTPSLVGLQVKLVVRPEVKVVFEPAEAKVKIEGPNPGAVLAQLQANGGLVISSGQQVRLEIDDDGEGEITFKSQQGVLKVEAPSASFFLLKVTCEDSSDNTATATATPTFTP